MLLLNAAMDESANEKALMRNFVISYADLPKENENAAVRQARTGAAQA